MDTAGWTLSGGHGEQSGVPVEHLGEGVEHGTAELVRIAGRVDVIAQQEQGRVLGPGLAPIHGFGRPVRGLAARADITRHGQPDRSFPYVIGAESLPELAAQVPTHDEHRRAGQEQARQCNGRADQQPPHHTRSPTGTGAGLRARSLVIMSTVWTMDVRRSRLSGVPG